MLSKLIHWRVVYYLAWIVPALIASFANFSFNAGGSEDATWLRYFQIHFVYWMSWGVIGELIYRASPQRLDLKGVALLSFMRTHAILVFVAVLYFSICYWAFNPARFANYTSLVSFLQLMYFRAGPVMYHIMNVVTYAIVLGVCLFMRQSQYAREQDEKRAQLELLSQTLETRLSESKVTALANQIHPHFLFNAMNNIASLISAGNAKEAYRAVTLLAGLLRKTFQYVRQPTITLGEELELVDIMMKIGKLRFDDRLSWSISMPVELGDFPVPPFLIQPLVENALRHGLEATLAPVHINIEMRADKESLSISVSDNGPGATAAADGGGVGLENLRERLALMTQGVAEFRISEPPGGGFRADIRLPIDINND